MAEPTLPPEKPLGDGLSARQRVLRRNDSLRKELSSWLAHWRDINDFILPRRLSYLTSDKNDGSKKNGKIVNNTATRAARILGAGKMAGETSPARRWSRYNPPKDLKNNNRVVSWVSEADDAVNSALSRSNLYSRIHEMWYGQGAFGTAVLYIEEDDQDDIRGYIFPLGQYALASTKRGAVDTCYREFTTMTVEQVVREFGLDNCSNTVREQWRVGNYDEPVSIIHRMEPNINRETGKIDNKNMLFRSEWWEKDAPQEWDKPLRISGFEEQPFVTARWNHLGDDVYGTDCPGMDALGDTKGLQHMASRRAEVVDKLVTPPMKAPTSMRTSRLSMLPRDATYVDEAAQGTKVEPMLKIPPEAVSVADASMDKDEHRIMQTFHADLFQMFLMDDSQQPRTATDINRRYEEKMLQLGPVITLDNDEVLDPMHNRILHILLRRGKISPPPPELMGRRIQVEYISSMAQAQKLLGTAATERFLSLVGSVSAIRKDVIDLPVFDKILRNYAEMVGMAPEEINPEDVVAALRQGRAQQEQMATSLNAAQGAAQAAKVASEADTSGDNILSRLLAGTGMSGPSAYGGQ